MLVTAGVLALALALWTDSRVAGFPVMLALTKGNSTWPLQAIDAGTRTRATRVHASPVSAHGHDVDRCIRHDRALQGRAQRLARGYHDGELG
jgi:hypothetical protein